VSVFFFFFFFFFCYYFEKKTDFFPFVFNFVNNNTPGTTTAQSWLQYFTHEYEVISVFYTARERFDILLRTCVDRRTKLSLTVYIRYYSPRAVSRTRYNTYIARVHNHRQMSALPVNLAETIGWYVAESRRSFPATFVRSHSRVCFVRTKFDYNSPHTRARADSITDVRTSSRGSWYENGQSRKSPRNTVSTERRPPTCTINEKSPRSKPVNKRPRVRGGVR